MRSCLIPMAVLLLSACGEKEERACCAIVPARTCESELVGAGVLRSEVAILMGASDLVCPSEALSAARIRDIAKIWAGLDSCEQSRGADRLRALDAGLCPISATADAPALPPGVSEAVATRCATGLVARGVKEKELWLMLGAPEKVCPTADVTEARIRDLAARDWEPAGCTQFTPAQMLEALNSGACAGAPERVEADQKNAKP